MNNPSDDGVRQSTAVSIFDAENAGGDFPVLKAFQQYIDAEQAKARKRMLGLSVFFILLLLVVVLAFMAVMASFINRNQMLSDRLLDIALKEKTSAERPQPPAQPVVVQAPPQPSGPSTEQILQPVLAHVEKLVSAIVSRQQQSAPPTPTAVPAAAKTAPAESEEAAKLREELKKRQQELEKEREKVKQANEKVRQAEIEKHRRRLYPEYYAREDARREQAPLPAQRPAQPAVKPAATIPAAKPAAAPAQPAAPAPAAVKPSMPKPIDYFSNTEEDELDEMIKARKKKQSSSPARTVPQPAPKTAPATPPKTTSTTAALKTAKSAVPSKPALPPSPATETLEVGAGSSSIPWLIESPAGAK